jgi:sugar lactone lactonase YvrE
MGAGADAADSGWTLNNVRVPDVGGVVDISANVATSDVSLFFKPDGAQFFIAKNSSADPTVLETFDLSTAYDITTVSHTRQNSAPESYLHHGMFWKPDGTKVFFIYDSGTAARIYSYDVSSAWNTSSTFSNSVNRSTNAGSTNPRGLFIDSGGTHLYHTDISTNIIYEYSMSTAWDLTTISYVASFDPNDTAKVAFPTSVWFKSDGSAFYINKTFGSPHYINEYALSTAWDITTATFTANVSMDWATADSPTAFTFNSSGTKLFFYERQSPNSFLMSGTLTTAWDISTFTVDYPTSSWFDSGSSSVTGFTMNDSGTKFYLANAATGTEDFIYQYNLSSAYALAGAPDLNSPSVTFDTGGGYDIEGLSMASDGSNLYAIAGNGRGWSLSTPFDLSTASGSGTSFSPNILSLGYNSPYKDLWVDEDGDRIWVVLQDGREGAKDRIVTSYPMSTAFNITTLSAPSPWQKFDLNDSNPQDIFLKSDGTKMFVVGSGSDRVREYALSTAFDLTTASYTTYISISAQETLPLGLAFKSDGTKMYIIGYTNDTVFEYDLSSAWDVSTATYNSISFLVNQGTFPSGIDFKTDGTKMYICYTDGKVYQYALSTAWDVSTASFESGKEHDFGAGDEGIRFKSDGLQIMRLESSFTPIIEVYPLSVAWDISTVGSLTSSTTALSGGSGQELKGLFVSSDGTKVFVVGNQFDSAIRGDLSTAWDLSDVSVEYGFDEYSLDTSATFTSSVDSLALDPNGTKMIVLGDTGKLAEYTFTTPWDTGTASLVQTYTLPSELKSADRIYVSPNGVHLFVTTYLGVYKLTL